MSESQKEACNGGQAEEGPREEANHSLNHLQMTDKPSTAILHTR